MIAGQPIDIDACRNRWPWSTTCRCKERCAKCGHGPHMAVHGGVLGKPGFIWGHAFVPKKRVPAISEGTR